MTRVRRVALLLVALLVLGAGSAQAASSHLNAYSIEGQFFCTSCHEPLNQVNSPQAQSEKSELQHLVNQGLDMTQVKAAMVDYYGPAVLAAPPARGFSLLIYILPPAVVVFGLGVIAISLPRWRRYSRAQTAAAQAAGPDPDLDLDPVEADRLDEELSRFDA